MKNETMNLPNILTISRIVLIPLMLIVAGINYFNEFIIYKEITLANIIVLAIFVIASLTDFFDGYIARKRKCITDFGKFMDPLADKILIFAAFIILLELERIPGWIITIMLAREFMVTGIRLIAANNNHVIAASNLGKLKTISQIVAIIALLLNGFPISIFSVAAGRILLIILIYIAAILTVISGIDYIIKNKDLVFKNKKRS